MNLMLHNINKFVGWKEIERTAVGISMMKEVNNEKFSYQKELFYVYV